MSNTLILYSTNTWLAYNVAERYFRRRHYVWCTPFFDSIGYSKIDYTVAPTSCPKEIYLGLHKEVDGGDKHSSKIGDNKLGIMKGAALKKDAGIISEEQEAEIASITEAADIRYFRPLLYIIPYQKVSRMARRVPVNDRAHPLSVEYIIEDLPRSYFDVIEWE